jgi:hypothetical protein
MAIAWGVLRDRIRRSVLADVDLANWSDEQIQDLIGWALQRFALHTAIPTTLTYTDGQDIDGTPIDFSVDLSVPAPLDTVEPLSVSSRIYVTEEDGDTYYVDPKFLTPGIDLHTKNKQLFWVWPEGTLNFAEPIGTGSQLDIYYFAYYSVPAVDAPDEILPIPIWAEKPIATLVGAYALESYAVQSATIDRWKVNDDAGNPEHNALRKQMEFMLHQYELMLAKYPVQDRTNFFREFQGDSWQ